MKYIKKLIITFTFAFALLLTMNIGNKVYASEMDGIIDEDDLLDNYEIYIDEQGQIYYIEKDPIEDEDTQADEVKEKDEDNSDDEQDKEDEDNLAEDELAYSEEDLRLLACLIYTEAGNQPYKGMLAVANVVLNRVESDAFWHVDTIEEVIYDDKWSVQFTVTIEDKKTGLSRMDNALKRYDTGVFTCSNSQAAKKSMDKSIKAAKAALEGENNIGGLLFFRVNRNTSKIKKKYDYKIIGNHMFYRSK